MDSWPPWGFGQGVKMELYLHRKIFTQKSTIGEIGEKDNFLCFSLEDVVRGPGVKVPGKTAIPPGRYEIIIDYSNRFKKLMPHVLNVPMFEGIRIHSGNDAGDTEGCILVGMTKAEDFIGRSRAAYDLFYSRLEEGLKHEKCFINIA